LAVGGAVVDHGDPRGLERLAGIVGQARAQGVVVGDHAEEGLVALLRDLGCGGRGGDLRDAGLAVDARGRKGAARGLVADHAVDMLVGQLLRHQRGLVGQALVVLGVHRPVHRLAGDLGMLGVELADGHLHTVHRILPAGRERSRQGDGDADHHAKLGGLSPALQGHRQHGGGDACE